MAFALEGASFFVEAIFIAIYVYGWDRLSPRAHVLSGIPIVISGFTGAAFVIAVNGWMNNPTGFDLVEWRGHQRQAARSALQLERLARAHPHVPGGVPGRRLPGRRRLRGRCAPRQTGHLLPRRPRDPAGVRRPRGSGPGRRRRLGGANGRREPAGEAGSDGRASISSTEGADLTVGGVYVDGDVYGGVKVPDLLSLLAFHRPERRGRGPRRGARRGPPAGRGRSQFVPAHGRDRHLPRFWSASGFCGRAGAGASSRNRSGSCARSWPPAPSPSWR